jgi:hypothetical protein
MLMLRPDLDIPHRTYIRTHLTSLYESVQTKLLLDLPESAKVSIALDGWQSPFKRSFLLGGRLVVSGVIYCSRCMEGSIVAYKVCVYC